MGIRKRWGMQEKTRGRGVRDKGEGEGTEGELGFMCERNIGSHSFYTSTPNFSTNSTCTYSKMCGSYHNVIIYGCTYQNTHDQLLRSEQMQFPLFHPQPIPCTGTGQD